MASQSIHFEADKEERRTRDSSLVPVEFLVGLLVFWGLVVTTLLIKDGLKIVVTNVAFVSLVGAGAMLGVARYSLRAATAPHLLRLKDFSESVLMFMIITLLGVIASYPLARSSVGFADAALARTDQYLGFNWVGWYAVVAGSPVLQHLGATAYSTIFVSPALLLGWMAWTGSRCAARRFLLTFWIGAVLTLLLYPLMPAKGPLAFLWQGSIPYMPISALYQDQLIPALRAQELNAIDLSALRGLVCAPSFHTAAAVIYIAAAWPISRLRWPLLLVNVAMLLSTPVEGTHYLTDMILGVIVAFIAIALGQAIARLWGRRRASAVSFAVA